MAGRSTVQPLTAELCDVFLEYFAATGQVGVAAKRAGVRQTAIYQLRKESPAFEKQYQAAYDMASVALEDEAVRRGKDGVQKPVFYRGQRIALVREYSDQLLVLLLKGRMRQTYGDQLGLSHDGAIEVKPFNYNDAVRDVVAGAGQGDEDV